MFKNTFLFSKEDLLSAEKVIVALSKKEGIVHSVLEQEKNALFRGLGVSSLGNPLLYAAYKNLVKQGSIPEIPWLKNLLQKRRIRTLSGIAPIAVLTKPFPCPGKCIYCPTERVPESGKTLFEKDSGAMHIKKIQKQYKKKGALVMPKSYLSSEPAAMRALLNNFDPWKQVRNRISSLLATGHSPEKCELIVMGGTFSFLPKNYQQWFVKKCLQAMNNDPSPRKPLKTVQRENETASSRAIGIVLETRPDHINRDEVRRLRTLGCTRVEVGVQTLDDAVSSLTKRGHGKEEVKNATKLLRNAGFKICHHMMPGLPGSTPEGDLAGFRELFSSPDFRPDYLKIYPCVVTPFSELESWHKDGRFSALEDEALIPLLLDIKEITPPWVRISRLIRDIPGTAIVSGSKTTNLRQYLAKMLEERGAYCKCIRCREIKEQSFQKKDVVLVRREYDAGDGKEIFLSFEIPEEGKEGTLVALLRLRIPSWIFGSPDKPIFRTLWKSALVRELHTYGNVAEIGAKNEAHGQHRGFGKALLQEAERIASEEFGLSKIAVISGIGVKEYYRKQGYEDDSGYMVKRI